MLLIQLLVVTLSPEASNADFVTYVWPWVIGFLVISWVVWPWISYLWIINLKYFIEDERLVIQKGILTKKHVSIPYSAVTDFTLKRSLYERWLEIGTLLVQTAGQSVEASGYEGKLEGLTDFDTLHALLRSRIKTFRSAMQGVPETAGPTDQAHTLEAILEEVKKIARKLDH